MTQGSGPYIRPGFLLARVANPVARHLGFVPALIVRGRTTGRTLTVPMGAPLELDGKRYLVSGRGQTQWVRNLRAAGRGEFRFHGTRSPFRAIEVVGRDREAVVREYRLRLGRSVEGYFREVPDPAEHPVFRMDPMEART